MSTRERRRKGLARVVKGWMMSNVLGVYAREEKPASRVERTRNAGISVPSMASHHRRMLEAIESQARTLGFTRLQLETNRTLTEAIALYRSSGYREVPPFNDEPYAHHWFEKEIA